MKGGREREREERGGQRGRSEGGERREGEGEGGERGAAREE